MGSSFQPILPKRNAETDDPKEEKQDELAKQHESNQYLIPCSVEVR